MVRAEWAQVKMDRPGDAVTQDLVSAPVDRATVKGKRAMARVEERRSAADRCQDKANPDLVLTMVQVNQVTADEVWNQLGVGPGGGAVVRVSVAVPAVHDTVKVGVTTLCQVADTRRRDRLLDNLRTCP